MRYRSTRRGRRADRALVAQCQRALFGSAREHWQGSRAALRRAVRRWVRAHRNDRAQLVWALRRAGSHSAFAILLLGLSTQSVHAQPATFTPIPSLAAIDADRYSSPSFADLDGDGDLDLVSGGIYGQLYYFENTGSAMSPAFVARTGSANPFDGFDVGRDSPPALGDLDGDGDLDLVSGERYGQFFYFENTGTATSPAFVARTGSANPFDGFDIRSGSNPRPHTAPALADLDKDGDLDLVSGEVNGVFHYFQNTGTPQAPAFVQVTGGANPLNGLDVGGTGAYFSTPAFGDLDGDGDLDLISGVGTYPGYIGRIRYYENTGTAMSPAFAQVTGGANPFNGFSGEYRSNPSLGDLDGDGDLDFVTGEQYGTFVSLENVGTAMSPSFVPVSTPVSNVEVVTTSRPVFGDLDDDGDLDLILGQYQYYGQPIRYFENTGTAMSPSFAEAAGPANPFNGLLPSSNDFYPALADLDGDGDLDLVAGGLDGRFFYFENTGTASNPAFSEVTGAGNPLDGVDIGRVSAPAFADLDDDGDLDLVVGGGDGFFFYFENTGTAMSPAFIMITGSSNPLPAVDVGFNAMPAFSDVDGDGDLDLVAGEYDGVFNYFENTGTANSPAFAVVSGPGNPLDTFDVGSYSAPAFADLDDDGNVDLFSGEWSGRIMYFVPEPEPGVLTAASIATVGWLARRRRAGGGQEQ